MGKYYFDKLSAGIERNDFLKQIEDYAENNKVQVYVLSTPLIESRFQEDASIGYVVLTPKRRILFVHHSGTDEEFSDYVDDVKDDLSFISKKYDTEKIIGRKRSWDEGLFKEYTYSENKAFESLLKNELLIDQLEWRRIDIFISLMIGSINDASRIRLDEPDNLLDKIRYKIQLFDTDQTRFIYEELTQKIVRIQGLAGTGKTELLLHKLKDLYTSDNSSKIALTCHNRVLANSLKKRIPQFFDSMRVDKQIEWEQRLWCFNAWGRYSQPNSGLLRLICNYYSIPFFSFKEAGDFNNACKIALKKLREKNEQDNYLFDYVFIDEGQDFEDSFIDLCEYVTRTRVYVAGDIFQSIFEDRPIDKLNTDFLLSRCYRTDPKTLMFAQGLGMGLFEQRKLYWLEKEKWEICGYSVNEDSQHNTYTLTREPIRRFEDLSPDYTSLVIEETKELASYIVSQVKHLQTENPDIRPSDICIIFLDNDDYVYSYDSKIGSVIEKILGWEFVLAHETKDVVPDKIVITNRNNIKGLEFPFVFCITQKLTRDHSYRNAIYTMLSRSFLRSYLVVADHDDNGLTEEMKRGASNIMKNKNMVVEIPSAEEIRSIKQDFDIQHKSKSLRERIEIMMMAEEIPLDKIDIFVQQVKTLPNKSPSDDQLKNLIHALKDMIE